MDEYYIKFYKFSPAGFPFEIGFKIEGWIEGSRVGKIDKKDADFYLNIDSNLEFKKGFFDKIFDYIKYLTSFAQSKNVDSILREKMTLKWLIAKIIAQSVRGV